MQKKKKRGKFSTLVKNFSVYILICLAYMIGMIIPLTGVDIH